MSAVEPGGDQQQHDEWRAPFRSPSLSLPKGGGAIRGIGERFAANPVTGAGTFSVPLPASPGRNGFGPQLALSYDSGSGNGPFGVGWSLPLPAVTRKTEKGLPRYTDADDTFLLTGFDDLVPVLDAAGEVVDDEQSAPGYRIRRYRPRVDSAYARIERWTRTTTGDVHWRSIAADNVLSVFGSDDAHRIADPADRSRIFSWLLSETRDDKGNAVVYDFRAEDGTDLDIGQAHERDRGDVGDPSRTANRYLDRIRYGNVGSLLDPVSRRRPPLLDEDVVARTRWMFELAFDYAQDPGATPDVVGAWSRRPDPFSTYRAGFEVRTYRLCRRVLMFHDFPDDPDVGSHCLVRSLELSYRSAPVDGTGGDPGYSFLASATQHSHQRHDGQWHSRQLPPLEFTYSTATIDELRDVDPETLANLPVGLGAGYQWIDLDGEGLSGVLTEQGGTWFYRSNLGSGPSGPVFGPLRPLAAAPSIAALASGRQQLLDVSGNGALALVDFHPPLAGFHERDEQRGWAGFVPFAEVPNLEWDDPNLRFVDLTGDGLADVLISGSDVLTWHASLADRGFAPAAETAVVRDERDGPQLLFADAETAVFLADMSGDGLADLVRIRPREVAYWPNLGYSHWGRRVVMDRSPQLDSQEGFDHRRVRLADVDGSGTTDLIYLGARGAQLWFNCSGNGWSAPRSLPVPVATSELAQIQVADLFGTGTACLVWSSNLAADDRRPLRYLDLMGRKPHLLTEMRNNLGAVTTIAYASSTTFYLRDQAAGAPWATRLPFPVHCVEQVSIADRHRKTVFATSYSYHHGSFDGVEREFRGFGRVEQVDTQAFDDVAAANAGSPFVTADQRLYQPPVKTTTWFHTGVARDRTRMLGLLEHEYFAARYAERFPAGFVEHDLGEPEIETTGAPLDPDEWREAIRACKGLPLREETVELDVTALRDRGEHQPVRLFSAVQHGCRIRRVQPRGRHRNAVFVVVEDELVTYHHELDLRGAEELPVDPRVEHRLDLRFDDYGRSRQSVAVVYPRRVAHTDRGLDTEQLALIRTVQSERHLAYTQTRFTDELPPDVATHRVPTPCEVRTYEVTGIGVPAGAYLTPQALRDYRLDPSLDTQATRDVTEIGYHEQPPDTAPHKRIVEHTVTLHVADDLTAPRPLGEPSPLGLTHEAYRLALTGPLLDDVLGAGPPPGDVAAEARAALAAAGPRAGFFAAGYQAGAAVLGAGAAESWWMRTGVAGFAPDAADHFYLPERYLDPFGHETRIEFDAEDLFVRSSTDARGNAVTVERHDHRVLAPARLRDANGNVSEAAFDIRGLPVATALLGKTRAGAPETGDTVAASTFAELNPDAAAVAAFFGADDLDEIAARRWLGRSTTRFLYHVGEAVGADGRVTWADTAAGACGIARERHERDAPNDDPALGADGVAVQISFSYSDGAGQAFVKKLRAEPDPDGVGGPLRWITDGKTVANNKGKPVLQYEPQFSPSGHRFAEPAAVGVSPVMFYDAPGRLVRTEFPDGTTARDEVSPWLRRTFDRTDTVGDAGNAWYATRTAADADARDRTAARMAALHAGTPAETHLDTLGRDVVAIAHNRTPSEDTGWRGQPLLDRPWPDERLLTFTKLDAEGKPLWICDARGNLVMQYVAPPRPNRGPAYDRPADAVPAYDVAGNLLFQHSMDAGDRWMLCDGAGRPMRAWDVNVRTLDDGSTAVERRHFATRYDALHRLLEHRLTVDTGAPALVEAFGYVDTATFTSAAGIDQVGLDAARERNLLGQATAHHDPSGLATVERVDVHGAAEEVTRTLVRDVRAAVVDWDVADRASLLEPDTYVQITEHDALGRSTTRYGWHLDDGGPGTSSRVAVSVPAYNPRGLVESERLYVRASKQTDADGRRSFTPDADPARSVAVMTRVTWDAKGQKLDLVLGNGTTTRYTYDPATFRLVHLDTRRGADVVQDLRFTYDPVGNITHVQDDAQDTIWFANQQVEPSGDYLYDALYRLIEATGRENAAAVGAPPHAEGSRHTGALPSSDATRNYTQRYRYDAVGNIVAVRHSAAVVPGMPDGSWTREYAYAFDDDPTQPASNRLWQTWEGGDRAHAVTYRHDPHGNMLNLANTAPGLDVRWDWRDLVRALDLQGGGWAFYSYGIDKQRTRKRLERTGGTEDRIYLGDYERYRRTVGGTVVEEIESHHVMEGEQRVLLVDDVLVASDAAHPRPDGMNVRAQTLFRYQYANHLGTVATELDQTGRLISHEEFHPYGTSAYRSPLNSAIDAPPKHYRYTGMERDEESGLSYHGERYLSCSLMRWIAPDPAGTADGMNRWAYSRLNPLRFADPSGLASSPVPTPVPFAGSVLGALIQWWNAPTRLEEKVAESERLQAQRVARQVALQERDPDTLSLGEAIEASILQTNDPTYGQDPFNQQFTVATLSALSVNAYAPVAANLIPDLLAINSGFAAVGARSAAPTFETATSAKWLSRPDEPSMAGTATRREGQEELALLRDYPARSLADMIDIANRAGIEMHPDMYLIVNDKMVDTLAKRFDLDPKTINAIYAPERLWGPVGLKDLLVEINGREVIRVYVRERILSSVEEFVATVAHESHELSGIEARMSELGPRAQISALRYRRLVNTLHDETPGVERSAVDKLRNSGY